MHAHPQLRVQKAWLLSNVRVRTADDPGKDDCASSPALAARVNGILASQGARIGPCAITVLRKGFDPRVTRSDRGSTHFCYTVLVDGAAVEAARPQALVEKKGLRERCGRRACACPVMDHARAWSLTALRVDCAAACISMWGCACRWAGLM